MESANSNHNQVKSRCFAALYRQAKALRRTHKSKALIARMLGVHPQTVYRWIPPRGTHRRRGVPRSGGRPAIITPELLDYLEQMRHNDPATCLKSWNKISCRWIVDKVEEHCGLEISRESVRRIRKRLQTSKVFSQSNSNHVSKPYST